MCEKGSKAPLGPEEESEKPLTGLCLQLICHGAERRSQNLPSPLQSSSQPRRYRLLVGFASTSCYGLQGSEEVVRPPCMRSARTGCNPRRCRPNQTVFQKPGDGRVICGGHLLVRELLEIAPRPRISWRASPGSTSLQFFLWLPSLLGPSICTLEVAALKWEGAAVLRGPAPGPGGGVTLPPLAAWLSLGCYHIKFLPGMGFMACRCLE